MMRLPYAVSISGFSGLSTNVDSFVAELKAMGSRLNI